MEAQDLHIAPNLPPLTPPEIRVKAQLGFQSVQTKRGSMNHHTSSIYWHEDLVFVTAEPLEDSLILLVEDRTGKDPVLLGHVLVPVGSIEQRMDERPVASKWLPLEGGSGGAYCVDGSLDESGGAYCVDGSLDESVLRQFEKEAKERIKVTRLVIAEAKESFDNQLKIQKLKYTMGLV